MHVDGAVSAADASGGGADDRSRFGRTVLSRELNAPQLEAVLHPPQPLLVIAGAGSGKTRVITYRLARLVAGGADPARILAVTFTNKAAGEMRERVGRLMGGGATLGRGFWIGTFHSIAARLLRRFGEEVGLTRDFVIYDDDDQRRLLQRVLTELQVPERLFPVRQVQWAIDRAQNAGQTSSSYDPGDYFDDVVGKAWRLYDERLRAANATDFGGLLLHALRLAEGPGEAATALHERFDHVLVDEFQDTNVVQYRLVRLLARRTGSLTVVGDEDQSIYRWRGADIRNILGFQDEIGGAAVVKLEENYRSTGNILRAANAVIARNQTRRDKRLFTAAGEGALLVSFEGQTERDEAEWVAGRIIAGIGEGGAPRDHAVFYRTNAQSRALEEALRGRDIPYTVVGGTRFYDRAEVKDLIAYLRALINPEDGIALARILNVPARGIGDTTAERVAALAQERQTSFWAALVAAARDEGPLGAGPRRKVATFVDMMVRLKSESAGLGPADLAEKVLELSGYRDALAAERSLEAEGRLENLLEVVGQMREYEREAEEPSLSGFLERITLASDQDGYDPDKGAVSLMTVHTAKGLEFPVVFLTGLEERVFPHARAVDAGDDDIEEERRLAYVALTRARRHLYLSRVRRRRLGGQEHWSPASRFLREIPSDVVEAIVQEPFAEYEGDTTGRGPWAGGSWSRNPMTPLANAPRGRMRPGAARAQTAAAPGELSVHYDDDAGGGGQTGGDDGLHVGQNIRHAQFGVGEVRAWQGSGKDLKVTVRFPGAGVKTILARFLQRA